MDSVGDVESEYLTMGFAGTATPTMTAKFSAGDSGISKALEAADERDYDNWMIYCLVYDMTNGRLYNTQSGI